MTDEAFREDQRRKYGAALAALVPGTRQANLAAVALYGRRAGIPPAELVADILANAPGGKRPDPSAVRRAVEHAARTVELGGVRGFAASEVRYRHEYLGEVTGTGDEIFPRVRPVELSEADIGGLREIRWGMDFGQGDPTVLVGTAYEARRVDGRDIGGVLTVFDEFYRRDARNCEVFEAIASRGLGSTPILGDPGGGGLGVINELRWMGARGIRQAYKPPGSVERGIGWLRECAEIRIDRRRCPDALREFSTYCYDKLRDGTNRNAYPDRDNHAIDAVRYAREAEVFARGGTSRLAGW